MKTNGTFKSDTFLNKNLEFWKALEIVCVVECCGIDAFDFSKETIQKKILDYNELDIIYNIESLIYEIDNSKLDRISSYLFHVYEDKNIFKNRMNRILIALK
ncbi:MAG: hypothetical protein KBT69_14055 [Oceanihabitans sp.]|nr:hypothetical protein [Oceanihabitans sp.]